LTAKAPKDVPRQGSRTLPYWLLYVSAVATFYLASLLIPSEPSPPNPAPIDEARAKATLDLINEMTKLITALNTAIVGAAAAITVKGKEWSSAWRRSDGLTVVAAFVAVGVSYYGIYLGQMAMLGMVFSGAVSIEEDRFWWAQTLQYLGTLTAIFLVGLVFVRMLEQRRRE
jgi:hypothetical protein